MPDERAHQRELLFRQEKEEPDERRVSGDVRTELDVINVS
ncbi:hypothetical protein PC129_g1607 [Phytophthora cactorum]|uniref:Uncharacterized protein n=1 Tax=Phytophthora cactorum TaxID=29920 RepID=A0A329STG3_9STRA|nr:hypothetical protein Pcac1_g7734 [Phytophthora cactorum]KAG2843013.1 hypothetical protein PC112_g2803 [Phytophthora cactorum]KAG2843881.1 hypothetical protein PC111_g2180 [Phytophthora cactorum]KAG2866031.1 hypothetical protein PC113_g3178 [Phytophthora cactorum]KAG2928431.1 hypothetical protein PC114_g3120 [Phytophthora cactorum]